MRPQFRSPDLPFPPLSTPKNKNQSATSMATWARRSRASSSPACSRRTSARGPPGAAETPSSCSSATCSTGETTRSVSGVLFLVSMRKRERREIEERREGRASERTTSEGKIKKKKKKKQASDWSFFFFLAERANLFDIDSTLFSISKRFFFFFLSFFPSSPLFLRFRR